MRRSPELLRIPSWLEREIRGIPVGLAVPVLVAGVIQLWHTNLLPGTVENDFGQLVQQSATWSNVFTVNGFYSLGYPLILRLVSLLTGDAFLAGKLISLLGGLLALVAVQRLVRDQSNGRLALVVAMSVALNWHFFEFMLLVGYALPLLAASLFAILAGSRACRQPTIASVLKCGALSGVAALFHGTALVLGLAFGITVIVQTFRRRWPARLVPAFVAGFLLLYTPQIVISLVHTGSPFHTAQAKNVWFGIYGQWNWQDNWQKQAGDVTLIEVIRMDPAAFIEHWLRESAISVVRLPMMILGILPPTMLRHAPNPVTWIQLFLSGLCLAGFITVSWHRVWNSRHTLRTWRPAADDCYHAQILVGWILAISMAFSTGRFLLVPWILGWCYLALVLPNREPTARTNRFVVPLRVLYATALVASAAYGSASLLTALSTPGTS